MNSHCKLHVDWCSRSAALLAVEKYHYSTTLPRFKLAHFGVWESGHFIGAIIFGCGAARNIGMPWGLKMHETVELVRVALWQGKACVTSKVVTIACKMFARQFPKVLVIVSYADTAQGHHGGIYQAMGWYYVGTSSATHLKVNGKTWHPRGLYSNYGTKGNDLAWLRSHVDPSASRVKQMPKHKYIKPLNKKVESMVKRQAKPYPKRARSVGSDTPVDQTGEGSASLTRALSGMNIE